MYKGGCCTKHISAQGGCAQGLSTEFLGDYSSFSLPCLARVLNAARPQRGASHLALPHHPVPLLISLPGILSLHRIGLPFPWLHFRVVSASGFLALPPHVCPPRPLVLLPSPFVVRLSAAGLCVLLLFPPWGLGTIIRVMLTGFYFLKGKWKHNPIPALGITQEKGQNLVKSALGFGHHY